MYIRKTVLWKTAIFTLAALGCATAFALINRAKLKEYELSVMTADRRAFAQLCEAVSSIDSELSRSALALGSTPRLLMISNEICRHSEAAKTALAALPPLEPGLIKTADFLSLTADYCGALAMKSASGATLSEEDAEGLLALTESSHALANELNGLYLRSGGEDFFSDPESADSLTDCFSSGMSFAEENMPQSPVLIYDGPYSSHMTERTPAYTGTDSGDISVVDGIRIASDFLGVRDTEVKYLCRTDGDGGVQIYNYTNSDRTDYVSVTVRGGHVIAFTGSSSVGDPLLSGEEAAELGLEFLASAGYPSMVPSYWYSTNGICYINYHYLENGTVVYPDLIQLGVRLDSGATEFMNAFGYLWNHRDGRNTEALLTPEQAKETVSAEETEYRGLCIIPSAGKNELLCHEFLCTGEETGSFLIYINAVNGATENIFVLVENERGTLTV